MSTIVFVDNDSKWIANYKRMLTPFQDELHCSFFNHPEEAMEYMATHPTEVLVSELDMPVMSGSELFEMVDLLSPATVKIGITQVRNTTDTLNMFNRTDVYKLVLKPFFVAEELTVPIRAALEKYEENMLESQAFQRMEEKLQKLNEQTERLHKKLSEKKQGHDRLLKAMLGIMEENLSVPVAEFDPGKKEVFKELCAKLLEEFFQYYMYEKKNLIFYLSYLKNKFHRTGRSCIFDIQNKVREEIPVTVMNRIAYVAFLSGFLCEQCLETYHVENMLETEGNEYVLHIRYDWENRKSDNEPDTQKLLQSIVRELQRALSDRMQEEREEQRHILKLYFRREEEP